MKYNRVISTAVLFLLLGTTLPAFAQKGEEAKGGGGQKAQPAQRQAQPQRQVQPQRQQQAQTVRQQPQTTAYNGGNNGNRGNGSNGSHYGRISDVSYGSHFGHDHSFHMGRPQMIGGYNRFQYGGYWFGYNQGWPAGWGYDDNVYVVYQGGGYYMYDLMHPGIHISLNIF